MQICNRSAKMAPVRADKKKLFCFIMFIQKNQHFKVFLNLKLYISLINLSQTAYFNGLTL